jgi:hypothetical protein
LLLLLLAAASAGALDFGVAISQEAKVSNEVSSGADLLLSYTPVARPWVSAPLGKAFNLYLSGSVGFAYAADFEEQDAWREPLALPELGRTELVWAAAPSLYLRLGRQRLQDATGLVAAGLFDGVAAGFSAAGSRFSAGVWYTGLLYNKTADIVMTLRDRSDYAKPFDLGWHEGYFASRRALVSFEWEKPDISPRSALALGLLGQFDLNGGEDRLHTQYLYARFISRFASSLEFQADAVFGAGLEFQAGEDPDWGVFFAGGLGLAWTPHADQRLSLRGLYSTPSLDAGLRPFAPVSSVAQGQVFSPSLAGLSAFRAAYTLRPLSALSLTGEASYFIRSDTVSFADSREPDNLQEEGYFLGLEAYASAVWTPLPDLALTLGGGAFFPGLGDAFTEKTAIRWKAALGLILSL